MKRSAMQDKVRSEVSEGRFTGAIESQTSRIPSSGYLAAAFGAITASAILKIVGKDDWALFVGQWPAAFLLMGVYNKMVKQHGSDAYSKASSASRDRGCLRNRGRLGSAPSFEIAFDTIERALITSTKEMDYVDFGLDRVGIDCWVHREQASEQDCRRGIPGYRAGNRWRGSRGLGVQHVRSTRRHGRKPV